jgi:hypothetical protein
MGALRKLRRISRNSEYAVEPLLPAPEGPADFKPFRKMSEVLMDFADPLYDGSEDDALFESLIGFAVICWNISLMDEKDHPGLMKRVVNDLVSDTKMPRFEAEDLVRRFIERKKTLFEDDRRMIADFRVYKDKGQDRIMVMSAMTKPRTASSQ